MHKNNIKNKVVERGKKERIMENSNVKKQFIMTYTVFMINGMLALSIGSLLPFIRDSKGLTYAFAGLIVSLHSVGNFISSFIAGYLPMYLGRKKSILIFEVCFPLAYLLIYFSDNHLMIALAFILTGIARGASSNFNNTTINNLATGKAWAINVLHAMFSIGAFLFPLILIAITKNNDAYWIYALIFMIIMGIFAFIIYAIIPVEDNIASKGNDKKADESNKYGFFKEKIFWICTLILFFYLCAEQGVIGWMVTYFKDSGFLDATMSQITASVLWIMMLIGRLLVAYASTRFKKENLLLIMGGGISVFFILLLMARSTPLIVLGIMGFGFSMAGIYPTTVSFSGEIIKKYKVCWSFMLTMASFGSILMPSIVGRIAESAGIISGMISIIVVVIIDMLLLISLKLYMRKNA